MKLVSIIITFVCASVLSASATIVHIDHDMSTADGWDVAEAKNNAALGVGNDDPLDPSRSVHYNAGAIGSGGAHRLVMDNDFPGNPVEFQTNPNMSLDITMRMTDVVPKNHAGLLIQLWGNQGGVLGENSFSYFTATARHNGNFKFKVYRKDALGNNDLVVNIGSVQAFPTDEYFTLSFNREAGGRWTMSRSDTGETFIDTTETTLITSSEISFLRFRNENRSVGYTGIPTYFDHVDLTSIPEPASVLLVALGAGVMWRWRRQMPR